MNDELSNRQMFTSVNHLLALPPSPLLEWALGYEGENRYILLNDTLVGYVLWDFAGASVANKKGTRFLLEETGFLDVILEKFDAKFRYDRDDDIYANYSPYWLIIDRQSGSAYMSYSSQALPRFRGENERIAAVGDPPEDWYEQLLEWLEVPG